MSNWTFTIHLADLFHRTKEGGATLQELAAAVVFNLEHIRRVAVHMDEVETDDIDDLAYEFQGIVDDPDATAAEFDDALRQLFDWGDIDLDNGWPRRKMCWVNVSFPRQRSAAA